MKNVHSADIRMKTGPAVTRETIAETPSQPLEVNVVFTDLRATAVALKSAESLARALGASIRLRAAIVVPMRLPLEHPHVSVTFMEQLLSDLVNRSDSEAFERTVHLYVCRNWTETLLQALRPKSVVVIGARRCWWPAGPARLARSLRAKGHRVVFVDGIAETTRSLQ